MFQESGRDGRNENIAEALTLYGGQNRFLDEDVKAYCLNGNIYTCTLLCKDFLFASINSSYNITGGHCCDIFEQSCNCNMCMCNI